MTKLLCQSFDYYHSFNEEKYQGIFSPKQYLVASRIVNIYWSIDAALVNFSFFLVFSKFRLTTEFSITNDVNDSSSFLIGNVSATVVINNLQVSRVCKSNVGWLKMKIIVQLSNFKFTSI